MFFRAGVLGQMEEFRDDRLGKIMSWLQAWIRGYLARKDYKKIQEQRIALQVVQRNLRKYLQLRTWPWYKLWQKVKPLLNVTRVEDEIAVSIRVQHILALFVEANAHNYERSIPNSMENLFSDTHHAFSIRSRSCKHSFHIRTFHTSHIRHGIYTVVRTNAPPMFCNAGTHTLFPQHHVSISDTRSPSPVYSLSLNGSNNIQLHAAHKHFVARFFFGAHRGAN